MKKQIIVLFFLFLIINGLNAQTTVSGILDSSVSMTAGAGVAQDFSYGLEEFANIRFQSRLRDRGTFFGAVNLLAATGDYAVGMAVLNPSGVVIGENYIAGIELERLYFRLNFENANFDGGLFRLPFGYSQVWGSSDFLNPKNPLKPDARPRGILGMALSAFTKNDVKLSCFASAPRNPFLQDGSGLLTGISAENHWDKASVQVLYSFETPNDIGSKHGIHRAGLSVKADIEVGLVMDLLYTYNHEEETKADGLSFSFGADYSFFDGKFITMAEYLYNGEASSTALGYGGSFSKEHYLYTGFTFAFNDFTNMSISLISGLSDISFTPVISFNREIFQGASINLTAQLPLDRDLFNDDGNRGELGPLPPGSPSGRYFNFSARLRLRF